MTDDVARTRKELQLTASDIRSLRSLCQRGGGTMTPARATKLAPLVRFDEHRGRYQLSSRGYVFLKNSGQYPRYAGPTNQPSV